MGKLKEFAAANAEAAEVSTPASALVAVDESYIDNFEGYNDIADQYEVDRALTLPVLRHAIGETVFIRVESEITKQEDRVDANGVMVAGPYVGRVVDLRNGLVCAYVFNAVARKHILAEPNYVGKAFALAKLAPPPGKRYADMHVALLKPKA